MNGYGPDSRVWVLFVVVYRRGVLGFGGKKSIIFDIDKGLPWYLVRSWVLRDF